MLSPSSRRPFVLSRRPFILSRWPFVLSLSKEGRRPRISLSKPAALAVHRPLTPG
jgi:hypothetical protein